MLIRHYDPEAWLNEIAGLIHKPRVRLAKVPTRHHGILAWATYVSASYRPTPGGNDVNELLWFCGNAVPENTAVVERAVEERLEYLEQRLKVLGCQATGGRFLTELEAAT